jgi:hypothetical protein
MTLSSVAKREEEEYESMEIYENMDEYFQQLLITCRDNSLLRSCGAEKTLAVLPLAVDRRCCRLVIHPEYSENSVALVKDIYKRCQESPLTDGDMEEIMEKIEQKSVFYSVTLLERDLKMEDYQEIDQTIRSWNVSEVYKVLQLCCFFEVSDLDILLLSKMMEATLKLQSLTNDQTARLQEFEFAIGTDLEALLNAVEHQRICNEFVETNRRLNGNLISMSMRICEPDGKQSYSDVDSKILGDVTKENVFISTVEQVALLVSRVIVNRETLYNFYTSYVQSVKDSKDMEEPKKTLKILLMRKVINRIYTIMVLQKKLKQEVAVFRYYNWNKNNVRNMVLQKKRIGESKIMDYCRKILDVQ